MALAARTNVVCDVRAGKETGMLKTRGANREERACGVRPDKCEWAVKRERR